MDMNVQIRVTNVHLAKENVKTDASIVNVIEDVGNYVFLVWNCVHGDASTTDVAFFAVSLVTDLDVTSLVGNVCHVGISASDCVANHVRRTVGFAINKR